MVYSSVVESELAFVIRALLTECKREVLKGTILLCHQQYKWSQ